MSMKARDREQIAAHIRANVAIDANGCWTWQRALDLDGYGMLSWRTPEGARMYRAHRVAAYLAYGPLPEGKVIDHLCRNRACVNSEHIEVVTQRANVYRSDISTATVNAGKTHCSQGHEYTPENTRHYTWPTRNKRTRICLACSRQRSAEYARRARANREDAA